MTATWLALDRGEEAHLPQGKGGEAWCGRDLRPVVEASNARFVAVRLAEYAPRCPSCLRIFQDYSQKALQPLPENVLETVTVSAIRPSDSDWSVADQVMAALRRKRSWHEPTLIAQEVGATP